ncbi:acetyl hydrolase [Burkholderia lata]|uniref:alpha/beta hydrolase n=1 Tax=Burkholderia lata (strain ATCC 17760 / DSM 23089 / LMG 22485 / NCIMB 9086 / R18194 / 383) TaxID=482957 RepID=UPI001452FDA1|nr:alpha/beta hydrolase [Burkholderia lata]VWB49771.1 acetyl hydrolase [Burkholderia lata]
MSHVPLDPGAARVVALARESGASGPETGSPEQARVAFRISRKALASQPVQVSSVRDLEVVRPDGKLGLRCYRGWGTDDGSQLPCLLFFHSGGWVSGDLDTHDNACRAIASTARISVMAVDYRLAPEHPFPAAIEDAQAAYAYILEHASSLNIDATKIAVGGDSAGGNLAAVLTHLLRDAGGHQPIAQVLLYPATDFAANTASLEQFSLGPTLTKASLDWFADQYLPVGEDRLDWKASPLRAPTFATLPAAYVVTCGHDPLCDEGAAYSARLREAGVPVRHQHYPGQIHGFLTMGGLIPESTVLIGEVAVFLDQVFSRFRGA